ncbi:MAG: hypothetical protein Unbinned97contig1000_11 [Prokaryotic dsDNA virus sp.]|nr:MAG: hypothetical protein Unbinned97contig1000_11 [Prokaryotic dsDNA virus sp.]|tara:strand:- start:112 stop:2052 length:1941 start_codon:yes stop_codon:yes gene_type:complete
MSYKITYNGFGSEGADNNHKWTHLKVNEYSSSPEFSSDDQTHWSTKHTISGTALLNVDTALTTTIDNARQRLSKVGKNLIIKLGSTTIANVGLDSVSSLSSPYASSTGEYVIAGNTDLTGYPRCRFEINEFFGSQNAMVSFTFTWYESVNDGDASEDLSYSVLSHVWKQSFTIQENGMQQWSVNGTLKIRPYAPAGDGGANLGRNPDSYRDLVMPSIPPTFRIKSMQWGSNEKGDTLLYNLVFQEHARRLPAPAKRGTGNFVFRKSLDSQGGLLGHKLFTAELEGSAKSKTTDLLSSLLDASTKRIRWTGENRDMITSISVSERDIFSKKLIGLKVEARGLDPNIDETIQGGIASSLNFGILSDFVDDENISESGSVWGDSLICSFKRQFFIPYANYTQETFPVAQLMAMPNSPHEGTIVHTNNQGNVTEDFYALDNKVDDIGGKPTTSSPPDLTGDEWGEDSQSSESQNNKYIKVTGIERVTVNNNIAVASTNSSTPRNIPITTRPPDLYVRSEYTLTRDGEPPPMLNMAVPRYFVVTDEDTSVTAGDIDANGHRVYTRTINRTMRYMWGMSSGVLIEDYFSITYYIEGTNLTMWYPKLGGYQISRPFDPRTDSENDIENSTLFNPFEGFGNTYELEFSVPVGQT